MERRAVSAPNTTEPTTGRRSQRSTARSRVVAGVAAKRPTPVGPMSTRRRTRSGLRTRLHRHVLAWQGQHDHVRGPGRGRQVQDLTDSLAHVAWPISDIRAVGAAEAGQVQRDDTSTLTQGIEERRDLVGACRRVDGMHQHDRRPGARLVPGDVTRRSAGPAGCHRERRRQTGFHPESIGGAAPPMRRHGSARCCDRVSDDPGVSGSL